jgi:hypothetical protein
MDCRYCHKPITWLRAREVYVHADRDPGSDVDRAARCIPINQSSVRATPPEGQGPHR